MFQLPEELRHAYRALLRAATYLPDSAARAYIHHHTVFRFRDAANKIKATKGEAAERLIARYHSRAKIGKVWQISRQLERAGQGSATDLQRVLFLTYGRSGKRRRQLVQRLLGRDEDELPQDEKALEQWIQKQTKKDKLGNNPVENLQLKALIQSQKLRQPPGSRTTKLKKLKLNIPKTNIWGRATPLKLQANIRRNHWADTLEALLPPLPQYEWDRLRDFATGAVPFEPAPPRRSRPPKEISNTAILEFFTTPTNRQLSEIEGIDIGDERISTSLEKGLSPRGFHTLSPRFMRRLYALVWSMTPTISQDEASKQWITKWGGERTAALTGQVTAPSAVDIELFEGANDEVKSDSTLINPGKRPNRKVWKMQKDSRPERKIMLGESGYSQGITPTI